MQFLRNLISFLILVERIQGQTGNTPFWPSNPTLGTLSPSGAFNLPALQSSLSLPYSLSLWNDNQYSYTLSWNVTGGQTLFGLMALSVVNVGNSSSLFNKSWMGIGFGDSMLKAQFIVCHNFFTDTSIAMHQHVSRGIYFPPDFDPSGNLIPLIGIQGFGNSTLHTCLFQRNLIPGDGIHLNLTESLSMIWAFNPQSKVNVNGVPFDFHGFSWMGRFLVNFQSGITSQLALIPTLNKKVHGFGMMVVWLFLMPLGVFVARYLRSYPGWVLFKVINQSFALCLAISLVGVINLNWPDFTSAHAIFGWVIFSLLFLQGGLGLFNFLGFSLAWFQQYKARVRLSHALLGATLLIASVFQVGLGINNLYPWLEPQNPTAWYIYFFFPCFWVLLFGGTEYLFRMSIIVQEAGFGKLDKRQEIPMSDVVGGSARPSTLKAIVKKKEEDQQLLQFTWKTLSEEVANGKFYIVANKYIFDASKWIKNHPGGYKIIFEVLGTDVSNDFFHSAGFDVTQFIPMKRLPKISGHTRGSDSSLIFKSSEITSPIGDSFSPGAEESLLLEKKSKEDEEDLVVDITEEDWICIKEARRTNIHSRLAIQRLSTLLVGELSNPAPNGVDLEGTPFNPDEFRRYALTEVEDLSPPQTSSSSFRYAKMKFCLLYPFDQRKGPQPVKFLPGQYVEFQIILKGKMESAFYYGQSGNMTTIELLIQYQPTSVCPITAHLFSQVPGKQMQFKIRGPYGKCLLASPFNNKVQSHPHETSTRQQQQEDALIGPAPVHVEDVIYFVACESGIAAFIQLLNYLTLPLNTPLVIVKSFKAKGNDEISVTKGECVLVEYHYLDGWCHAVNLVTKQSGILPVRSTSPWRRTRLVLISLTPDPMAGDLCKAAAEAYPDHVAIHQLSMKDTLPPSDAINKIMMEEAETFTKKDLRRPLNKSLIIAGPQAVRQTMNDLFKENLNKWKLEEAKIY